ncbi:hypothetical protein DV735_g1859, partial [Chaetothyriales sp. CBS 134920]
MHLPGLLVAAGYVITLASAASLRIQIPASNLVPNPNALPASTHATLTSAQGTTLRTPLHKGSYLLFDDIPATLIGSHLLEIFSHNLWSDHGINLAPSSGAVNLTLTAKVLGQKSFYETRQGFNILSLLKNPMILMGLFALVFTFGMPKLIENMDPEMRQEYEEMQRKSPMGAMGRAMQGGSAAPGGSAAGGGSAAAANNFDLAGFLAGHSSGGSGGGSTTSAKNAAGGDGVRERKR